MGDKPQVKLKLDYSSNIIEIPIPNNYEELFNIFINQFKIEEENQKFLNLEYNDGEDDILIGSEKDFNIFIDLLKDNNLINVIKGNIKQDSDNDNLLVLNTSQDILDDENEEKNENENHMENKEEVENLDLKEKEKNNNIDLEHYKSKIKVLEEEKENQNKQLNESEKKIKELEDNLAKLQIQENYYKSQLDKLNLEITTLKEENRNKKNILSNNYKIEKQYEINLEKGKEKYNSIINDYISKLSEVNNENEKIKKKLKELEKKDEDYENEKKKFIEREKENEKQRNKEKKEIIEKNIELIYKNKEKQKIINEMEKKAEKDKKIFNEMILKENQYFSEINELKEKLKFYKKFENENKKLNKDKNELIEKNKNLLIKLIEKKSNENPKIDFRKFLTDNCYDKNNKRSDDVDQKNKNIINNNKKNNDINKNNNEKKESSIKKNFKKEHNELTIISEKKLNKCLDKTIHKEITIKCEQCSISLSPTYDEVFKCCVCSNYNLCKKCEEQNSKKQIHKHNFIKTTNEGETVKEEILDEDIVDINIEKDFSYFIQEIKDIYLIYCGSKEYIIKFKIKNNSIIQYPEGIEIKCDKGSIISPTEDIIKIKSLKPNEEQSISLKYKKLGTLVSLPYYTFLNFHFNNKKIGKDIIINLKFIETNNYELVDKFINKYNMIKFDFTKDQIVKYLIKKNCDFERTLEHLLKKVDPNKKK